jgi:hypothetical protein
VDNGRIPDTGISNTNCRCIAHVLTAFFAAAMGTKLPDDANRSKEQTYCVETTKDSPHVAVGIVACTTLSLLMHRAYTSPIDSNRDNYFKF